jgi:hypothetical protein
LHKKIYVRIDKPFRGYLCNINTCQFGSTCDDQINYYTCICAPGYHGDKCEIEINECDEYLPCKNGASCQDKIADYDCMSKDIVVGISQWTPVKPC